MARRRQTRRPRVSNVDAVKTGAQNLANAIRIVKMYGLPPVVAINKFPSDTAEEIAAAKSAAIEAGAVGVAEARGFAEGGAGMTELAEAVWDAAHSGTARRKPPL